MAKSTTRKAAAPAGASTSASSGNRAGESPTNHRPPQAGVRVRIEDLMIPTYLPARPDPNPMFLERRVYQGSSGKVYPLPFTDRIAEKPVDRLWKAIWIENEFIRALVLPQIGGRIHILQDKTNGYDLIYRQPAIRPALVGLAGPWISGGIEFNWPQHHRPATFLPVAFEVEYHPDGSKTIWCSDHDPIARMKGMHGVCLHPGRSCLELKVRAYNRTPFVQTFLWWANVATRVHEAYQSFFPPDVYYVADHARRSMSRYPLCTGLYYGVNYGARGRAGIPPAEVPSQFIPPHCATSRAERGAPVPRYRPNDLSFYANIPTPCSYMCTGTQADFFGGYDYFARAGLVHFANHHIAPGKKQWTWGNHDFGYAWDRNLTVKDTKGEYGPYIELMAGVYTDNQPDFSFLQPGETKTWSQYWYPIRGIGPAQNANLEAAVSLRCEQGRWHLGVAVTSRQRGAKVTLMGKGKPHAALRRDLSPGKPLLASGPLPARVKETDLLLSVADRRGRELIAHQLVTRARVAVPPPATEPSPPGEIPSADELFLTGLHLEQYRHATRSPTLYWQEALRRDPLDARCNNALGRWHIRRGEFAIAERHLRNAIARLTRRNANPYDGEAFYNLGLCLRYQGRDAEAYDAFYKSVWNQAWMAAGYHALAEIDCAKYDWPSALEHLECSLRFNTDNTRARNLQAIGLRKLGRKKEAHELLTRNLALDPLDWWARYLLGKPLDCDLQTALDLAVDYIRAGLYHEAIHWLGRFQGKVIDTGRAMARARGPSGLELPNQSWGAAPLFHYYLGWLFAKIGDRDTAAKHHRLAPELPPHYCFPARLEEIEILQAAMQNNPKDARAPYYLGNLLYDRRRHEEAISLWECAVRLDSHFSIPWRNLGIAYFNTRRDGEKARHAYDRAFACDPADARLLYERDQLWKRAGITPARRLAELDPHLKLAEQRDDLTVELCALYNQLGRPEDAIRLLSTRQFQPWEGGEGGPLGQHVRSHLALGRRALAQGKAAAARDYFELALSAPPNLGEARHLLANQSDVHFWLGCACHELDDHAGARRHWRAAATFKGDFQEMSVRSFSEMTYYAALSWIRLGQEAKGRQLFKDLLGYAKALATAPAKIDYFATSLPALLLFEDDLQRRQQTTALFLQAQAQLGLGNKPAARKLFQRVLRRDANHPLAADFLRGFKSGY